MIDSGVPTVLVTGAAGFIGGRLCEVLHLTRTANVRAGVRRWSGAGIARLARMPVDIVPCDILDLSQVNQAMQGVNFVLHGALGSREVNVEGTRHVLEAASQTGVSRVVFISSAEVYGRASGTVDETTPVLRNGWEYAVSKVEAEQVCMEYVQKGLPVSIVRPSIVYGPFSQTWIVRFAERLASGKWRLLRGYGDGTCNLIYVDDLIRGIWLAATCEQAVGQAFNLNGPEVITWNDYFQRFNAALGRPALQARSQLSAAIQTLSMNTARVTLVYMKNHLAEPVKKTLLGGTRKTKAGLLANRARTSVRSAPSIRELTRLYSRKATYSDQKAREMLGYMPRCDVDTGLALSVQWLAHHEYCDGSRVTI
jgi:nucleoside-diphosphate-sugar epimerase